MNAMFSSEDSIQPWNRQSSRAVNIDAHTSYNNILGGNYYISVSPWVGSWNTLPLVVQNFLVSYITENNGDWTDDMLTAYQKMLEF